MEAPLRFNKQRSNANRANRVGCFFEIGGGEDRSLNVRTLIDRENVKNDFNDRWTVQSTTQFTTTREREDTSRAITVRRRLLNKIRMDLHLCRKGHERTNRTRLTGSSRGPGWLQ